MFSDGDVPVLPRFDVFPNQDRNETELDDGLFCVVDMEAGEVRAYGLCREIPDRLADRLNARDAF
jgi:hypothetical protein